METINVRVTKNLISLMDKEVKKGRYANRSEFIREAIRGRFEKKIRPEVLAEIVSISKEMDKGKYSPHNEAVKRILKG
ncbi:MAG: ribbon-helix-helix domain-containing protein [Candidatus Thermoplasmatota archaeon]|nr:ribbon-helix-helix domain-containing protein [Candidatus Thermoplasmatota archaeon]MCG2825009.1 ribbon-helix-helix domain-containing protein [Thermoplasmatales archaeon]